MLFLPLDMTYYYSCLPLPSYELIRYFALLLPPPQVIHSTQAFDEDEWKRYSLGQKYESKRLSD